MKDPLGNVSRICYNAFNLPVSTTDANGIVTKYAYNDAGLVTRMERLDGSETLTSLGVAYNGMGRPVSYTDQDGFAKSFERDAFGKVLKEKFPDGSECAYSYDALGRRTSVIDENGHEIRFGFGRFGLESRTTAAGQLTDYVRDDLGLVKEVVSKWNGSEDRRIESAYDDFGRLVTVDYGSGETERFAYDAWNRLAQHTRGNVSESYKYDHFGRLVQKRENGLTTTFTYDAWGNRLSRVTKNRAGAVVSKEIRSYDRLGRLASTTAGFGSQVTYAYDGRGRLVRQTIDGAPIEYEYTKYGQLAGKYLGGKANPDASVTYEYSKSGQIVARTANGVRQTYEYDKKGQLLAVKDSDGNVVESYAYDKAGNMLKKTVNGKTTTFAFDAANQLVSSTTDGVTTHYAYDAAGRLVREGSKTYRYGYLDKVMSVSDGDTTRTYTYHADGQLASATVGSALRADRGATPLSETETFLWDGLALIQRGDEQFVNEPHVGGGNPVASSKGTSYFNDALGTTVGSKSNGKYSAAVLTAFGENLSVHSPTPTQNPNFFTGKPYVECLGHAFLMRNYRAGLAKWQSADPMGYPDGWNQLAYCGNMPQAEVDYLGCAFGEKAAADPNVETEIRFITGDELPITNALTPLGQEVHSGDKPRMATIKLGSNYTFDFKFSLTKALEALAKSFSIDITKFLSFDFEYKLKDGEIQYQVPGYTCSSKTHNQHGDDQGEELVVPYLQALAYVTITRNKTTNEINVSAAKVYNVAVRTRCVDLTNCKE